MYGEGISREGDLLDLASRKIGSWKKAAPGFLTKANVWARAARTAKQTLKDNPEVLAAIESEVKVKLGMPVREEEA